LQFLLPQERLDFLPLPRECLLLLTWDIHGELFLLRQISYEDLLASVSEAEQS